MTESSEILRLQEQMAGLQKRLTEAAAESQDFLYIVSHDFKGPLRAIMSSSMILLEDYSSALDATAKAELKRQSDAARRMNKMLEELLKLSRLNRPELVPARIDLGELFTKVAVHSGLTASQVSVEGEVCAVADRELMITFFSHLIDNSIKFAKPGVPVRLTIGRTPSSFYVKDEGIGISAEQCQRIFLPFEKLNGDDYPGYGMGLAACKRIMGRHSGSVGAEPSATGGMKILFSLNLH